MRWSLLLVGCGSPRVTDVAFPAVAIDASGTVRGHIDAQTLATTNRQAIGECPGLRVIDSKGRELIVELVKAMDREACSAISPVRSPSGSGFA